MATYTLTQALGRRFKTCDLVLAKTTAIFQQTVTAEVGRVYRFKHLFKERQIAAKHPLIEFVGGGNGFGEAPNYLGEVGFLFLNYDAGTSSIYQSSWHGHIPIEQHEDGLWCRLYLVRLWELLEVPVALLDNSRPDTQRLNSEGLPVHTLVRFDALETYFMNLITELDQKPCEPLELVDIAPWIASVRQDAPAPTC